MKPLSTSLSRLIISLVLMGCAGGAVAEDFEAIGKPEFSASSGIQAKGGSQDITIRRATVLGNSRSDNKWGFSLGGSTAMSIVGSEQYEAQRITISDSVTAGWKSGFAFDGCRDCVVERNIVVYPSYNLFYIWRNNTKEQK